MRQNVRLYLKNHRASLREMMGKSQLARDTGRNMDVFLINILRC